MTHFKTDDGVAIYYETHGQGTPLVLCYGVGGNTDMWSPNRDALAAKHRLVLWEPRGHARSDAPEDPKKYSMKRWVEDLKQLLDHLKLDTAHVGGLSLGGGIVTRFTLWHSGRVRSLIVTNSASAAGRPYSPKQLAMRQKSIEITLGQGMDAMAEFAMTENPDVAARVALDPAAKAEFYDFYRRHKPHGYANAIRAMLERDEIVAELPNIKVPVLLIGGDRDGALEPMRIVSQNIPGAKFVVLSPATHFANRDQPAAWNKAALDFLDAVDAGAKS